MNNCDQEYYSRRERQERERAARSDNHAAKRLHLEMAERYSSLLGPAVSRVPEMHA